MLKKWKLAILLVSLASGTARADDGPNRSAGAEMGIGFAKNIAGMAAVYIGTNGERRLQDATYQVDKSKIGVDAAKKLVESEAEKLKTIELYDEVMKRSLGNDTPREFRLQLNKELQMARSIQVFTPEEKAAAIARAEKILEEARGDLKALRAGLARESVFKGRLRFLGVAGGVIFLFDSVGHFVVAINIRNYPNRYHPHMFSRDGFALISGARAQERGFPASADAMLTEGQTAKYPPTAGDGGAAATRSLATDHVREGG